MRPEIKAYLDMTRGSGNYKESEDDVASSLANRFSKLLKEHRIEVVIICSVVAKNEMVTCSNGTKAIIWDTNYWMHFAYYYQNIDSLEQHVKFRSPYIQLQCDALWRDLFRIALLRVGQNEKKYRFLFVKHYLSYGMRNFPLEDENKGEAVRVYERMVNIANAKMYAFLHELAHVTAVPHMEYYTLILKRMFGDDMRDETYSRVLEGDNTWEPEQKERIRISLDEMRAELFEDNYTRFQEIIADMRAIHSMCSCCIVSFQHDASETFFQFKQGIVLERSFNLRIRNIEAVLREFSKTHDEDEINRNLSNSQFGREFLIRDRLMEVTEKYILCDCFAKRAGKDFLEKYITKDIYSHQTAVAINEVIGQHMNKIRDRILQEGPLLPSAELSDTLEILDYLLYYPAEENDHNVINRPISFFKLTGLVFDGVVEERN